MFRKAGANCIILEYSNHSKVVTHCQYACIISNFKGAGIHLLLYFFPHHGPSNPSSPYIHIPYCLDILVCIPVILDVFRLKTLIPSRWSSSRSFPSPRSKMLQPYRWGGPHVKQLITMTIMGDKKMQTFPKLARPSTTTRRWRKQIGGIWEGNCPPVPITRGEHSARVQVRSPTAYLVTLWPVPIYHW